MTADSDDAFDDPTGGSDRLLSLPRLVLGVHLLTALGALAIATFALLTGQPIQFMLFGAMAGMIAVAGVAAARIAGRRD